MCQTYFFNCYKRPNAFCNFGKNTHYNVVTKLNYHKQNFFKNTYCVFKAVDLQLIENKTPNFTSRSGSQYFYTNAGVYRFSSHWGRAATCRWRLQTDVENFKNAAKLGFAKWTDFYKDNEVEKLYFIQKSEFTHKYEYFHKHESFYNTAYILRTAGDTRKVLRQIKTISTETKWAKYIPHNDLEDLRTYLIQGLITTNKTLPELRRLYSL